MRRRPEAVAALVNGLIVWLLPTSLSAMFTIGQGLRLGVSDTNTTVYADGWTPLDPIMATMFDFGVVMLPFAAVAAWRTWIHATRWRALGTDGWRGVGEAGACGVLPVLVVLTPGLFSDPALVTPYVLTYGTLAALGGLVIGLLLRASALIVLKATEPRKQVELVT